MTSPVLFNLLDTANAMKIGVATLNSPQTLNGLSLDMCKLLNEQLQLWKDDDGIALVVINGAGERAFCAGGDLHGLYKGIQDNVSGLPWNNTYAREFFDVEYRLDYLIHTFPKPVVCWGNGIVMGGGVGLMMGASHRIVSETTRFAMPEISIGLFPDVGGTWMLSRLPGGTGLFLALTGAQLGASDCRFLGLADYTLVSAAWNDFLAQAQASTWSASRTENDVALNDLLKSMAPDASAPDVSPPDVSPPGPLERHYGLIRHSSDGPDFDAICAQIKSWATNEDPWLKRAAATFNAGSPGSARLCFELLKRVRHMSLAEVFRQEYIVSLQCGVQGDFKEGIRALLIDKDKQPKWNPASLEGATQAWVQRFFEQPWPDSVTHPLADLA